MQQLIDSQLFYKEQESQAEKINLLGQDQVLRSRLLNDQNAAVYTISPGTVREGETGDRIAVESEQQKPKEVKG